MITPFTGDGPAPLRLRLLRGTGLLSPLPLLAFGVVAVVVSPLVFVGMQASQAGWDQAHRLLGRPVIATLVQHTLALSAAVTLGTAVIGFGAAYLIERTDLPGRRWWTVLLALPLAVPEFVRGYSWVSLYPSVHGYWGAVLVMTCSLYPLVLLPVAATLRRTDGAAEEVSRSLGHGPWATLWRVTVPLTRPALAGGALLVSLYLLGEYGAFAMLRYTTFATAIFTEYKLGFDAASASLLTLVLVLLALLLVGLDAWAGRRGRVTRPGGGAPRPAGGAGAPGGAPRPQGGPGGAPRPQGGAPRPTPGGMPRPQGGAPRPGGAPGGNRPNPGMMPQRPAAGPRPGGGPGGGRGPGGPGGRPGGA
ncbi:ABC transporter permease subunit, partial [Streptomyces sp. CBMA152]|uniref:ABC transporter permease n=1 Tax=Streptomyces sp. CBMA152 TaxID=1896312 RepID=UPI0016609FA9